MKRSIRWYFAWGTMVASLSMLFFMATAGPAQAWTQLKNYFDTGGDPVCSGSHGLTYPNSSIPCLYWQEPHYTSISLYFIMDSSLDSSQSGGYDFNAAIYNAFTQYNNVAAWNPYMYQCFSFCQGAVGSYYMTTVLPCLTYGKTDSYEGSTKWGYNPERGENEYYAFFSSGYTMFSSTVHWNNNLDWSGYCYNNTIHADGRTVATHESGHQIGLGHTYDDPSIMYITIAALDKIYKLTTNSDIPAIQGIYPGNQESS